MASRHGRGVAALGEPPRPSHISRMVRSTVKLGTAEETRTPREGGDPEDHRAPMSRAMGCWASGVSKFRGNVRLSVQRKCHSVRPGWYQMTAWQQQPPGFVALEGLRHPCISLWWLCGFPIPARLPEATSPCAWLSESPSIAPSEGTSVCAQGWLWDCRRPPRSSVAPLLASSARMLPMAQPARTSRSTCRSRFLSSGSLTETLA